MPLLRRIGALDPNGVREVDADRHDSSLHRKGLRPLGKRRVEPKRRSGRGSCVPLALFNLPGREGVEEEGFVTVPKNPSRLPWRLCAFFVRRFHQGEISWGTCRTGIVLVFGLDLHFPFQDDDSSVDASCTEGVLVLSFASGEEQMDFDIEGETIEAFSFHHTTEERWEEDVVLPFFPEKVEVFFRRKKCPTSSGAPKQVSVSRSRESP